MLYCPKPSMQTKHQTVLLSCFVFVLLTLPMVGWSQIRTYYDQDPAQEEDNAIGGIRGAQPPPLPKVSDENAAQRRLMEILNRQNNSKNEPIKQQSLLGRAMVFVEFDRITEPVYRAIKKLNSMSGLEVMVVMPAVLPRQYLNRFAETGHDDLYFKLVEEVDSTVDVNRKIAIRNGVSSYRTIIYQSPYGDKKRFKLTPLDPFLQELDRIKRRQR